MLEKYGKFLSIIITTLMLCGVTTTYAAERSLADNKVVLQISDPDPSKQTLVLNVANNLIKAYGKDEIDIEIVAFGPGLRLVMADNVNSPRIASLVGDGVKFTACGNTQEAMSKALGRPVIINSKATVVPAGAGRILELMKQDYRLIKP